MIYAATPLPSTIRERYMATTERLATIDDLEQLHDTECRYDLIRGELIKLTPAGGRHGEVAGKVYGHIWTHVSQHGLGRAYAPERKPGSSSLVTQMSSSSPTRHLYARTGYRLTRRASTRSRPTSS